MFTNLDREQTARHVQLLGWLVLATGLLGLVGAACLWIMLTTIGLSVPEPEPRAILPVAGLAMGGFIAVLSSMSVVAGIGLLRRTPWGRMVALIDAFLGLIWFPLGTLIGVYAFWVLLQAEAPELFGAGNASDEKVA